MLSLPLLLACAPLQVNASLHLEEVIQSQSPVTGAFLGSDVALDGPRLVAGSSMPAGLPGRAHVFVDGPNGWTEEAILMPAAAERDDGFGRSGVDLSADALIVGALGTHGGAAFVFRRSASGWIEEAMLTAPNGSAGEWFGHAVAIDGDLAVVGAPFAQDGEAWVFKRGAVQWNTVQRLRPTYADSFGWSVDLDSGHIAVGAPGLSCGHAFAFARTESGYSLTSTLFEWIECNFDSEWAHGIDVDGNRLVLSDYDDQDWDVIEVQIYERANGVWCLETTLPIDDSSCLALSKIEDVALAGDKILTVDTSCQVLHLYGRNPFGNWTQFDSESPPAGTSAFGSHIALTRRRAAVGVATSAPGGGVAVYRVE